MSEDGVAVVMPIDVAVTDTGIITLMMEITMDMVTEEMAVEVYTLTYDGEEVHKTSIITGDDDLTIIPRLSSDGMFLLLHDEYSEEPSVLYVLDDGVWVPHNVVDVPRGYIYNFLAGGKIARVDQGTVTIFALVSNLPDEPKPKPRIPACFCQMDPTPVYMSFRLPNNGAHLECGYSPCK